MTWRFVFENKVSSKSNSKQHRTAKKTVEKMKIVLIVFACVLYKLVNCTGYIDDTKAQDCSNGTCIDVCQFDGLSLLPGTEITNDGNCRRVRCNQDFSVQITL